mmetsp:Transcript_17817/g.34513  ORF Transcript_17817/g.34513 Transcript_17817/m.34513 type:complete len:214 (+) Transcript_17817:113-754(+)
MCLERILGHMATSRPLQNKPPYSAGCSLNGATGPMKPWVHLNIFGSLNWGLVPAKISRICSLRSHLQPEKLRMCTSWRYLHCCAIAKPRRLASLLRPTPRKTIWLFEHQVKKYQPLTPSLIEGVLWRLVPTTILLRCPRSGQTKLVRRNTWRSGGKRRYRCRGTNTCRWCRTDQLWLSPTNSSMLSLYINSSMMPDTRVSRRLSSTPTSTHCV